MKRRTDGRELKAAVMPTLAHPRSTHPPPWCMVPETMKRVGGGYDADALLLFKTRLETADKAVAELRADRDHLLRKLEHREADVREHKRYAEKLRADIALQRQGKENLAANTKGKVDEWLRCGSAAIARASGPVRA